MRSAADQSFRGMGLVVRCHVPQSVGYKRRVYGKWGKANTSAGGGRRKGHRAEDGGRNVGTGGGEAFAEQIEVPV